MERIKKMVLRLGVVFIILATSLTLAYAKVRLVARMIKTTPNRSTIFLILSIRGIFPYVDLPTQTLMHTLYLLKGNDLLHLPTI